MRRILFVDDEQHVLDGLQNMLRRQRHSWNMTFVSSGDEALIKLAAEPFDMVVTDMRMPGMDGAALLRKVKDRHPSVARMILSGQADRGAVTRALAVTQQFISKPCSQEALREMVERVCSLQTLLSDDGLRALVGSLDRLPSVPRAYVELTRAIDRPDASALELAEIVESDPALSIKVLQLVNSAWFGEAYRTRSIASAVSYIGADLLKSLALTAEVFAVMDRTPAMFGAIQGHQQRAVCAARLARRMIRSRERASEAFTAALVHDIGQVVLALGANERLVRAAEVSRAERRPLHEVERDLYGVTHAEVGAYLLGLWGLPFEIVEAVAWHHRPGLSPSQMNSDILGAVHVASGVIDALLGGEAEPLAGLDQTFIERDGLAPHLPQWLALAEEEIARSGRPPSS